MTTLGNCLCYLVIPESDELSGDEETPNTPPRVFNLVRIHDKNKLGPKPKLKRPKILRRKGSRNVQTNPKDWGERCVDVFEVINQIGEGM